MKLGYASPAKMLREMRPSELGTWLALEHEWGEGRRDLRAAIVARTMANIHRARGQEEYRAEDFMPDFYPKKQKGKLAGEMRQFLMSRPTRKD